MASFELMTHLNLNGQELKDFRVENVSALPTPSATMNGRRVYLTTDNRTYECRNGAWVKMATSSEVTEAQNKGKVTVEKSGDSYVVKQNGVQVGVAINVPKDMVVESGEIVAGTWSDGTFTPSASGKGKALMLVIANGGGKVYIDVADLVDAYTGGASADITVAISNTNQITATLSQTVKNQLASIANKVDKVTGKGLSTNDYTTEDKNKLASLRQALAYQSSPLEGDSGKVALDGFEYNAPIIMQATKAGKEIGISMTYEASAKTIKWASNTKFVASDNVTITAIQVQ